jgi:phenylacetate-CoA ligase
MLYFLKRFYDFLPKGRLHILKYIPNFILFGMHYKPWMQKISCDKGLFADELLKILAYSREFTQYGKDHIPKNINLDNVFSTLEALPIVSSHDLATNLEYYTSTEFNKFNSYTTTTGGTGRNPTTILLSNDLYGIEWAHVSTIWSHAGYDRKKHIKLTLRGKSLGGGKLAEFNPIYNEVVVDTFAVNQDNFSKLLIDLKQYDISYIHGYPSLVKEYIGYFKLYEYIPSIKGVFLASEGVSVKDKEAIKLFFNCPVISFYGQSERAVIAADFDGDGLYKVFSSYGYPRIVKGELVVTSFVNRALPLINYHIGDGAEIVEIDNNIFLKNLKSRWGKDFVYLNENKKISTTAINLHSKVQTHILYYQIIQDIYGHIKINVLRSPNSKKSDNFIKETLKKEMQENLKDFIISVDVVSETEIVKSKRGKLMLLVQNIDKSC